MAQFAVQEAIALTRTLPEIAAAPTGNVVPVAEPPAKLYSSVDSAIANLNAQMTAATSKAGENAPIARKWRTVGNWIVGGIGVPVGVAVGMHYGVNPDWHAFEACMAGIAAAAGSGATAVGLWSLACNLWGKSLAKHAPTEKELKGVKAIVDADASPVEAAALASAASIWQRKLEERRVYGFAAQEHLTELQQRGANVSADDQQKGKRWEALRRAIADHLAVKYANKDGITKIRTTFDALPADEQRALAPLVIEKLFKDEAPIKRGWDFATARALYTKLHDAQHGMQPTTTAAPLPAIAHTAAASGEPQKAIATSAIAGLDASLGAFEAALRPALKSKRSVLPSTIAPALAIASSASRTPVEIVAIGARATRFVAELDAAHIHGHTARLQLKEVAAAAEGLPQSLRDQIQRIDTFRGALDGIRPDGMDGESVNKICDAIDRLDPVDRKEGAQRAYARYFKDGVPRSKRLRYDDGQAFLKRLREHMRTA